MEYTLACIWCYYYDDGLEIYIYIYICHAGIIKERNKVSTTIKERNKVSTASAYYLEQRRARLIVDQRKNRQDRKRKQRQSASEGIIKKVKGDDAERRLAKQRQRMANHRARER